MHKYSKMGGCHCGNISVKFNTNISGSQLEPRACDCDFCRKHGASYISDCNGSLEAQIKDQNEIICYTQGSGTAQFIICQSCGVLAFVSYRCSKSIYAALNARILDDVYAFKKSVIVSPRKLSKDEKISRWREAWIPDVTVIYGVQSPD